MKEKIIIAALTVASVFLYVDKEPIKQIMQPTPMHTIMKVEVCSEWYYQVTEYCGKNRDCLRAQESEVWNDCIKTIIKALDSPVSL